MFICFLYRLKGTTEEVVVFVLGLFMWSMGWGLTSRARFRPREALPAPVLPLGARKPKALSTSTTERYLFPLGSKK